MSLSPEVASSSAAARSEAALRQAMMGRTTGSSSAYSLLSRTYSSADGPDESAASTLSKRFSNCASLSSGRPAIGLDHQPLIEHMVHQQLADAHARLTFAQRRSD